MNCIYCHKEYYPVSESVYDCNNHKYRVQFDIEESSIERIFLHIKHYDVFIYPYHICPVDIFSRSDKGYFYILHNSNFIYISPENADEIISNLELL